MNKSIKYCSSQCFIIVKYLLEFGKVKIGCDYDRAALVSFVDYLEKEVGLIFIQFYISKFIYYQEFWDIYHFFEIVVQSACLLGYFKLQQQICSGNKPGLYSIFLLLFLMDRLPPTCFIPHWEVYPTPLKISKSQKEPSNKIANFSVHYQHIQNILSIIC